ncbi:hypothetical protein [Streptomyces aidingensis]|uniref:Uncharacterized protein n=1 Tax=Streptomyces aidingensis TaxID=910347 RepID=A0A1I1GYY6_9ACTN|nr:hypothetical protein [Streptomyces aidingensis]SFC14160.1 hypothetical protein SAMN05421773_102106 [Streptomyces aidingensis]
MALEVFDEARVVAEPCSVQEACGCAELRPPAVREDTAWWSNVMEQEAVAVEHMDGTATAQAEDAFRLVYAEAFAEPPHNETPETGLSPSATPSTRPARPAPISVLAALSAVYLGGV